MEPQSGHENIDSIVLEEEIDPNYVPSEAEVLEYAKWLGMDLEGDRDLFWIAREGLMAPLPNNWKPCKTKDTEDIYYFNFATGESTWDHPCDGYYKRLYEEEKKKKETSSRVKFLFLVFQTVLNLLLD
jgi:centrosomal protein CEP164